MAAPRHPRHPQRTPHAYHQQHRLPERFEQILSEVRDSNQLARETQNLHVTNVALLFALVTVPAGIVIAVLDAIGSANTWTYLAAGLVIIGITAGLLATRTGRFALRTIRRRLS